MARNNASHRYPPDPSDWYEIPIPSEAARRKLWLDAAKDSEVAWRVFLDDGRVRAELLRDSVRRRRRRRKATPECDAVAEFCENASAIARVEDGWLVGFDFGEFGGGLCWISEDGLDSYRISDHRIVDFVPEGDEVVAIEGLAHLVFDEGSVIRIAWCEDNARWIVRREIPLPGKPFAMSLQPGVGLMITLTDRLCLLRSGNAIDTLLAGAPWRRLYPSSSVLGPDGRTLYIGMRRFVVEVELATSEVRYLVPSPRWKRGHPHPASAAGEELR